MKAKTIPKVPRGVKEIARRDGFGASPLRVFAFTDPPHILSSCSCLLPRFSMTLRVGELRKLLSSLRDEDGLTITVAEGESTTYTFVR